MVTYFAHLAVCLNGVMLEMQSGVHVIDEVNKPCRVVVESVLPEDGPEAVDPREAIVRSALQQVTLGADVSVTVVLYTRGRKVEPLLTVNGPVVACEYLQPPDDKSLATQRFTVEARIKRPDDEVTPTG